MFSKDELLNQLNDVAHNMHSTIGVYVIRDMGNRLRVELLDRLNLEDMDEKTRAKLGVFLEFQFLSYVVSTNSEIMQKEIKLYMMDISANLLMDLDIYDSVKKEISNRLKEINYSYTISDEDLNEAYELFKAGEYPIPCANNEKAQLTYENELQLVEEAFYEDK